jgi:hypothetical protein
MRLATRYTFIMQFEGDLAFLSDAEREATGYWSPMRLEDLDFDQLQDELQGRWQEVRAMRKIDADLPAGIRAEIHPVMSLIVQRQRVIASMSTQFKLHCEQLALPDKTSD